LLNQQNITCEQTMSGWFSPLSAPLPLRGLPTSLKHFLEYPLTRFSGCSAPFSLWCTAHKCKSADL